MIKVLNIISDTNIGGAGKVLLNYLQYSNKRIYDTYFAIPRGSLLKDQLEELGGKVYEINGISDRSFDLQDIRRLRHVISLIKPHIVHTHGCLSGRIAGKLEGCRVVYTRHSAFPVSKIMKLAPVRWINKYLGDHFADRIIAVSSAAERNLIDLGISRDKITTMMNGVAPMQRVSDEAVAEFRHKYFINDNEFLMVLLARIEEYKGHMTVVQLAERLKYEGRKFKIIFAGVGSYEQELKDSVTAKNLDGKIIFTGFLPDVAPILSAADLQLNASTGTETSSLSVLEGFSIGLPAVVSNYGGNTMLVADGVNGLIFEAGNSVDLYEKVVDLMEDRGLLAKLRIGAEKLYEERFTGAVFAKNVENVYMDCLKEM